MNFIINKRGAYFSKTLKDGRVADVVPLTYGRARLCVSKDAKVERYEDVW